LRHACGYALVNQGHDTQALQAYLGHKNIQHTMRYTELTPARFKDFGAPSFASGREGQANRPVRSTHGEASVRILAHVAGLAPTPNQLEFHASLVLQHPRL
jgi:type 1 fimbriae regulatory protein FimB/type 1 fimbriae regulatory protein FimE